MSSALSGFCTFTAAFQMQEWTQQLDTSNQKERGEQQLILQHGAPWKPPKVIPASGARL